MADISTLRRSPLDGSALPHLGEAVRLTEVPFLTMVSIRVDPDSDRARGIEAVLGTALPRRSGQVGRNGADAVLWLGPDEWLVVSDTTADELVSALRGTAAGAGDGGNAAIVDVSANRTVIEVAGAYARQVLEKGCPADLHPRAFADGSAITTTLARIPVLLWKASASTYLVLPRASFAPYVADWLLDAVQEFSEARDAGRS